MYVDLSLFFYIKHYLVEKIIKSVVQYDWLESSNQLQQ